MDEENNNNQQSDLDNNPVSQMEAKIADKTAQQVKNIADNFNHQVKNMAKKAIKAAGKAIAKVVVNLTKLIIKLIMATAPVSLIVIAVIVIALLAYAAFLSVFGGIANIFQNDMESGDVTTSEIASIYDENVMPTGGNFTITATDDMVKIGEEVHNVIASHNYVYNTGNYLNYPELLYSQRFKRKCY